MLKNTELEYGSVAKFFHWLIFLLVALNITLGFVAAQISDQSTQQTIVYTHRLTGLAILFIVILRLGWKAINPRPQLPSIMPAWERIATNLVHGLLYLVLLAMPLSGWIFSTAQGSPPEIFSMKLPFPGIPESPLIGTYGFEVHTTLVWVLLGLIAIHILGAFKHHFYDADHILLRMLPGKYPITFNDKV